MEIVKLFKKTTLYVVRFDNNNNLQDSAPCHKCLNMIIYLDIKRIVYSSKNNTFVSEDPKKITIKHESAGNKFLKKNELIDKENKDINKNKKIKK